MKKVLMLISIITIVLLSGCGLLKPTSTTTTTPTTQSTTEKQNTTEKQSTTAKQNTTTQAIVDDNTLYEEIMFADYSTGKEKLFNKGALLGEFTKINDNYYSSVGFVNRLDEPSKNITSKSQLVDILDYMAFYHIEEFEINVQYQTNNIKQDIIDSFWNTYFCPSTVGVKYTDSKIIMLFNDDANKYYTSAQYNYQPSVPYTFYSSLGKRSNDFDDFNYKNNSNGLIDVYNSDQLIYVLEKGYYPNIIENSPAETIYTKAISILRNIIYDDMTEKDKALAISSYILAHAYYDLPADEKAGCISSSLPNYPDYIASNMIAFYAEGALLYNQAVCHGFAKAFALLALIEGLDITKVSTPFTDTLNDDGSTNLSSIVYTYDDLGNIVGATYSSHGYNYVLDKNDNKYYICDPTYNYAGSLSLSGFNEEKYGTQTFNFSRSFAVFKAFDDWKKVYLEASDDYFARENRDKLGEKSFNWANSFKMKVGTQEFDLYIESTSELNAFKNNIRTYLSNYNDQMYINERCNIFCFNVYATSDLVEVVKDEIDLWGWRRYYGMGDLGYIFIFE